MNVIIEKILTTEQKVNICQLWNNEYPKKLSYEKVSDFESYLENLTETKHYLLVNKNKNINGWAFTFLRENQIWFAIIIKSEVHGKGFGTLLLNELKNVEKELNGWVIDHENDIKLNGEKYKSPIEFYKKNGFKILSENRIENEKISATKIKWKII
jgi:GNAT superfamily N-acetyltransferase